MNNGLVGMALQPRQVELRRHGLWTLPGFTAVGSLVFEAPAWVQGHRLVESQVGAFTFFNAAGQTSVYRAQIGRYAQIGESSIIGAPEHPHHWFSSHPFSFTRKRHMPALYAFRAFSRLAPDEDDPVDYAQETLATTRIGPEAYIGAGSFVRRGLSVGAGAVVGARSVVTRDVPPYAIVAGSPARVIRLRFPEALVERLLALAWWDYDLAPIKRQLDYRRVEACVDQLEAMKASGELRLLNVSRQLLRVGPDGEERVEPMPRPAEPLGDAVDLQHREASGSRRAAA